MGNCYSDSSQPEAPRSANYTSNTGVSSNTNSSYEVDTSNLGSFGSCIPNSEELTHTDVPEGSLRVFSYSDLKAATRNFREALGEGGFGVVYKGYVDKNTLMPSRPSQGMIVAVKRLKGDAHQGHREWLAEVRFLGALHHPNLVNLIGFCSEDSNRLLVYEFMSRGSLENHLFRRGSQPIPWTTRMKVAIDAARGLAFLHSPERQVIFRDFKASNILLDIDWNAKLSDFGLAKSGPSGDNTHVSTRVMGTHGYAAPEYLATGHLSAGSDVYSFGVVLLELLTGRRSVDSQRSNEEKKLVDWARPYLRHRQSVLQIVDERLGDQFPRRGAIKLANLAAQCLNEVKNERPTMKEVLDSLESLANLGITVE